MKSPGIQRTILLAVFLPSLLVAIVLALYFTLDRIRDGENAWRALGISMGRGLAASAEYAMVTGNKMQLDSLVQAAAKEPGVRFVVIKGESGLPLSWAGVSDPAIYAGRLEDKLSLLESQWVVSVPVELHTLDLSDPLLDPAHDKGHDKTSKTIGTILLGMSTDNLEELRNNLIVAGLLIVVFGSLLAGIFAIATSRVIGRPILRLSRTVSRLGVGDFSARATLDADGEIGLLQAGINRMAASLEQNNALLQERIRDATEDLDKKKREAEAANVAKSRFLASVSHDLRQPMHALGLFAEILNQQLSDPQQVTLVHRIQSSVAELEDMFNSLLDLSRLDAGVISPSAKDFDLKPYLQNLWEEFAPVAEQKGLALRMHLSEAEVHSDPLLLTRILTNLISNAIRYSERGGVLVSCRKREGHWLVQVWDTGIGIADDQLTHIFEEYYQVGNLERSRQQGIGLGLAIVSKLSKLLGHELQVRSRPGKGTVFSLKIAAAHLPLNHGSPLRSALATARFTGQPILVIDDDPEVADSMAALLESWNLVPVVASTLDSALDELNRRKLVPSVVLSDLRLPGEADGIEAIAQLREQFGAKLPAALISGDTLPSNAARLRDSGLTVLHKPLAPAKLRALLTSLLFRP